MNFKQGLLIGLSALVLLVPQAGAQSQPQTKGQTVGAIKNTILWDGWGVPHIYAENQEKAFYEMGWAQMRAHPNLIAKIYGQTHGHAAEHWGTDYEKMDVMVHATRINARAEGWWKAQGADYQRYIGAFARGINDYAKRHPQAIDPANRWVFPLTGQDVMAQAMRSTFLEFFLESWNLDGYLTAEAKAALADRGSNGYAIAPSHTADGNAMLVMNPHMPWGGDLIFFENHVVTGGIDAYGVSLVGSPMVSIAFTRDHGWTHTVNNTDTMDIFELTLKDQGYVLDGKVRPFVNRGSERILVKQADGSLKPVDVPLLESEHGDVIHVNSGTGRALALRFVGMDRPHAIKQYWDMLSARGLPAFEGAVKSQQLPYFNTIYANDEGHIFYLSNGILPKRTYGDYNFWRQVLPGNTSDLLWSGDDGYDALPKLTDPATGFIQNTNDPAWSNTYPFALDRRKYAKQLPPPFMYFRSQRATRMMLEQPKISYDQLVQSTLSTRMEMADRILPDLIALARIEKNPVLDRAADLLERWDRTAASGARGAVLFIKWVEAMEKITGQGQPSLRPDWFAIPWDETNPLTTPRGLKDPQKVVAALRSAIATVEADYGALDVPYGDVYRLKRGTVDVPASIAHQSFGVFAAALFNKGSDKKYSIAGGETFIGVVEFGEKMRAEGMLTYGNSSEPSSPHYSDQLSLSSQRKMRKFLIDRTEIEANTELRENF